MKKYLSLAILVILISCDDEPNTNLTGTWHFTELPQSASRHNRLDGSIPAFDILFEINGREVINSDLLIAGDEVTESHSSVDHGETVDFKFTSDNFELKLNGCKRIGEMMFVNTTEYSLPSGEVKTYKGLSVAQWWD